MTTTTATIQLAVRTAVRNPLAATVIAYWALFWIMNAADKLLNRTDLGPFTWHGKDRHVQFSTYFADMGLPTGLVGPTLLFAFAWEIVVGILFLVALARQSALPAAFTASAITFMGFSAFDVICGDRAELLEHGTYMALLLVGWMVVDRQFNRPATKL